MKAVRFFTWAEQLRTGCCDKLYIWRQGWICISYVFMLNDNRLSASVKVTFATVSKRHEVVYDETRLLNQSLTSGNSFLMSLCSHLFNVLFDTTQCMAPNGDRKGDGRGRSWLSLHRLLISCSTNVLYSLISQWSPAFICDPWPQCSFDTELMALKWKAVSEQLCHSFIQSLCLQHI